MVSSASSRQSDSQQPTVSLMSRSSTGPLQTQYRQSVSIPDVYPAFTLTKLILTPKSPCLRFGLSIPCSDTTEPREGREAKRAPQSAVGFSGQRNPLLHFRQPEQFKAGSALSAVLKPVLKDVCLTWKPVSKITITCLS